VPVVAPAAKPTKVAAAVVPEAQNAPLTDALATRPPRALHTMPSAQPSAKPVAEAPPALKPAAETAPALQPVAKPAKAPKLVKTEPAQIPAKAGGVGLQIGAYKSDAEANAAWTTLSHKHPMVAAYRSAVKKVDLGDKGIWYRLRMEGFADKTAAAAFCDKLKADGGNCFLAR
jgi:cell division protein FtsN